jgi:hypothetical protein
MRLALFSDHTAGAVRRSFCYMQHCKDHDVTYVLVWKFIDDATKAIVQAEGERTCKSFKIISIDAYVKSSYDVVINTSDKHFFGRLEHKNLSVNLVNKETLYHECKHHGILSPSIENLDGKRCFVKPKISSGAYDEDWVGYRNFNFDELAALNPDPEKYLVQEYLDTNECVLLIFLCNGEEIRLTDSCTNVFDKDSDGRPLCVYGDFTNTRHEIIKHLFKQQITQTLEMMYNLQYNRLHGTFNVQFSIVGDKLYLHDFNTRTGPFSIEIENRKFFDTGFYSTLDYQLGLGDLSSFKKESWIHYTEDQNGNLLAPATKVFANPKGTIQINSDKKSGMVRSDYNVFINKY